MNRKGPALIQEDEAIRRMRARRGLASRVARACGITRMAVYQWRRVPSARVQIVAMVLKMKPKDVRPDIFLKPKH
jgi:AmiR/NasT family two-component response regulator